MEIWKNMTKNYINSLWIVLEKRELFALHLPHIKLFILNAILCILIVYANYDFGHENI